LRTFDIAGIDQELDLDCFEQTVQYEINAYARLVDGDDVLVSCDPFNYFQGLDTFCPSVSLIFTITAISSHYTFTLDFIS